MNDVAERLASAPEQLNVDSYAAVGAQGGNKIGASFVLLDPNRVTAFVLTGMTHRLILDGQVAAPGLRRRTHHTNLEGVRPEGHGSVVPRGTSSATEWIDQVRHGQRPCDEAARDRPRVSTSQAGEPAAAIQAAVGSGTDTWRVDGPCCAALEK
jgi:hypothetical protein